MDEEIKLLAYKAINDNVKDSTARQIIRYVFECEIYGQDTISPSNRYLSKKYGWSGATTRVAISLAKKSEFIATTGYGITRCFELNVGFLKGKISEINGKKSFVKKDLLNEISKGLFLSLPNTLPNTLPNSQPNTLPNSQPNSQNAKNGSTTPQNEVFGRDNSNSNNYNNNNFVETDVSTMKILLDDDEFLAQLNQEKTRR